MAYTAINVVFIVTTTDLSTLSVASRIGWLAVSNLCIVVFLALKHTPMVLLSGTSHERLNSIHQLAGFLVIVLAVIHGVLYTEYFLTNGLAKILRRRSNVSGIVAGFAMALMGVVPLILKRNFYGFFHVAHVLTFIALITTIAFHQPSTAKKVAIMTVVSGTIWVADRIARFFGVAFNAIGNEATLTHLPDGGTRLILKRAPLRTTPGKHVFLWIPSVAVFQTHPFSVVSVESGRAEFFIHSEEGFTARLHALARKNPGCGVRAAADGAYGAFSVLHVHHFDRIMLIAGGSGASFTFGLARNLLQHKHQLADKAANSGNTEAKKMVVDFIWAVKHRENLSWFTSSLRLLRDHHHGLGFRVRLHVTRIRHLPGLESELNDKSSVIPGAERPVAKQEPSSLPGRQPESPRAFEEERAAKKDTMSGRDGENFHEGHSLLPGRPDVGAEIDAAVAETCSHHRILIAACGPTSLMKLVREVGVRNVKPNGPAIETHCETFGW